MHKPLNLIVIDDDSQRKPIYQAFVENYNKSVDYKKYDLVPIFAFKLADALNKLNNSRGTSLILLDMVRSWQKDQLRQCIGSNSHPMIALSEQFNLPEATEEYIYYAEHLRKPPPIIHFRDLRDAFTHNNWETVLDVFSTHLSILMDLEPSADWAPDRSVHVMHMTDVHMGADSLSLSELQDISAVLNSNHRHPIELNADFIAITGDLTDRGVTGNFETAVQRVRQFFEAGWMRERTPSIMPSARVLACPGNHDFNEQLAGARLLIHDGSQPAGFRLVEKLPVDEWRNWYYGLLPFAAFHRAVTGFVSWELGDMPGFRVNARFKAQGIFFVEIWAQEFRCGNAANIVPKGWIDKAIEGIQKEVSAKSSSGDTVIILIHDLSVENPLTQDARIIHALHKMSEGRNIIVLTGHLHTSKADIIKFGDGKPSRVLHVRTDTSNPKNIRAGSLPSFALLIIQRDKFVVTGCEVHRIEYKSDTGWTRNAERTVCFRLRNEVWENLPD